MNAVNPENENVIFFNLGSLIHFLHNGTGFILEPSVGAYKASITPDQISPAYFCFAEEERKNLFHESIFLVKESMHPAIIRAREIVSRAEGSDRPRVYWGGSKPLSLEEKYREISEMVYVGGYMRLDVEFYMNHSSQTHNPQILYPHFYANKA
jgi:hypothetical protein